MAAYGVGPPLQVVPATDDYDTALLWYEALVEQGLEGLVAKRGSDPYRAGRSWVKVRHADVVDGVVVGYTGPAARPRTVVVRLPDARLALSQTLPGPLAAALGIHLRGLGPGASARLPTGEPYTAVDAGPLVEVAAGTTRHQTVTVTRLH
ncbi:hypothetical protein [Streptomyces sp. NRRL B-1347]|uniref:hypothetical protein n=1 Tax=Streptomyces sp. NRRL B-1347 TaxID=1476877 RepID=UPI00068A6302|nr:hypothetical protein [Streptomyces sp. NRRL B-1347]